MRISIYMLNRSESGRGCFSSSAWWALASSASLVASAAIVPFRPAAAADLYYDVIPSTADIDGGTANWSGSNWKTTASGTTGGAWTANDTAVLNPIIGSPSTTTVTLAGNQTATAVTFNGTGYTLTGGTLALAGTGVTNWLNVNANATIGSALTHLRFKGTGEVTISGGGTIGARAIVGDGASGLVTVRQTGGTFTANDYLMVGGNDVAASQGAFIMDAGSLTIAQGIYLGWGGADRSGSFTQNGGSVENLNNTQGIQIGIGGGSGTYTLNGGTLTTTFGGSGAPYGGSFVFGGGTFRARASTTLYAGVATSIAAGATARIDTNGKTVTWGTALTGSAAAGLTKSGAGTLVLSANNTYTGTTTVSAGTLQIGSSGTGGAVAGAIVNDGSLVFNRSDNLTYLANVSGSGSVTKQGAGVLTLSGTNTYAGTTTISVGAVAISSTAGLPGWNTAGRFSVASGASINLSGAAVNSSVIESLMGTGNFAAGSTLGVNTTAANLDVSASLSGAGGLTKTGGNTLVLSGNNTHAGNTLATAGMIRAGSGTAFGTGTISATGLTSSSGAVDLNGFSFSNSMAIGSRSAGPSTAGALLNTNTTSASVLSGNMSIGGENYVGGNGSITFNGVVSGGVSTTYSFYKQGNGTWTFANPANTFDGFYYQISGTTAVWLLANINQASSLGRPTTVAMNKFVFGFDGSGGGTLLFTGSTASTSDRRFELQGATAAASNRIDASGATAANTLTLTGSLNATRAGAYTVALGGTNSGINTYSGVIANGSGTLALLKDGATTWSLFGTNTYSGTTAVRAGTLLINGNNASASGAVSVAAGATLGGSGTVGGATTISGMHTPGTSPGLQTFRNGLSYDSTATLVWELSANTALTADRGMLYDGIDLTTAGSLAINPSAILSLVFNQPLADSTPSTVDWTNAFWGTSQQWLIADLSSPVTWDGTTFGTLNVGTDSLGAPLTTVRPNASFSLTNSGGDLVLNYSAVPEPAPWLLTVSAAAGMLFRRCRRRTRNTC